MSDSTPIINLDPTFTLFTIPKKGRSQGPLEELQTNSREFKDVENIVLNQVTSRIKDGRDKMTVTRVALVQNKKLNEQYTKCRKQFRRHGYSDNEVGDSFGFLLISDEEEITSVCKSGLSIGNSKASVLGKPELGISVCRYSDCLLDEESEQKDIREGKLVVFKYIKGKVRLVEEPLNYPPVSLLEPQPGYDCHMIRRKDVYRNPFLACAVYIYEYDDLDLVRKPRQICPYAVVHVQFIQSQENQNSRVAYTPVRGSADVSAARRSRSSVGCNQSPCSGSSAKDGGCPDDSCSSCGVSGLTRSPSCLSDRFGSASQSPPPKKQDDDDSRPVVAATFSSSWTGAAEGKCLPIFSHDEAAWTRLSVSKACILERREGNWKSDLSAIRGNDVDAQEICLVGTPWSDPQCMTVKVVWQGCLPFLLPPSFTSPAVLWDTDEPMSPSHDGVIDASLRNSVHFEVVCFSSQELCFHLPKVKMTGTNYQASVMSPADAKSTFLKHLSSAPSLASDTIGCAWYGQLRFRGTEAQESTSWDEPTANHSRQGCSPNCSHDFCLPSWMLMAVACIPFEEGILLLVAEGTPAVEFGIPPIALPHRSVCHCVIATKNRVEPDAVLSGTSFQSELLQLGICEATGASVSLVGGSQTGALTGNAVGQSDANPSHVLAASTSDSQMEQSRWQPQLPISPHCCSNDSRIHVEQCTEVLSQIQLNFVLTGIDGLKDKSNAVSWTDSHKRRVNDTPVELLIKKPREQSSRSHGKAQQTPSRSQSGVTNTIPLERGNTSPMQKLYGGSNQHLDDTDRRTVSPRSSADKVTVVEKSDNGNYKRKLSYSKYKQYQSRLRCLDLVSTFAEKYDYFVDEHVSDFDLDSDIEQARLMTLKRGFFQNVRVTCGRSLESIVVVVQNTPRKASRSPGMFRNVSRRLFDTTMCTESLEKRDADKAATSSIDGLAVRRDLCRLSSTDDQDTLWQAATVVHHVRFDISLDLKLPVPLHHDGDRSIG